MSRPRFLADHDLNEWIVDGVLRREPVIEFARARDFELSATVDADLLDFAAENWIVVSHDVNTMTSAARERVDASLLMRGLILIHQRGVIADAIDDLELIWSASELVEWNSQVVFLPL